LTRLVLDASVAVKWYLPAAQEPLSSEAFLLLRDYKSARVDLLVPGLFFAEFANILWKACWHRRCDAATADFAIGEVLRARFRTISSSSLVEEALQLARLYNRTVYDCLYIALAIRTNTQVVTADERLANAVAGHLPVVWLGIL
jgi:predicted nucleic acid-binding protein